MSTTIDISFLGQQVLHLQAEVRTLHGEITLIRKDMADLAGRMVTREMLEASRDVIMARLGNLEAETTHGFRQLNEKMDRQHAAILALLKKD